MKNLKSHFTKNILAGLVAILPIGGLIFTISYFESVISKSGLPQFSFYFPGLGIILAVGLIYLIGLVLTTFAGKWLWSFFDKLLKRLPILGELYISLKQILGYGDGEDAVFQHTVLVPAPGGSGMEYGLVTNRRPLPDGAEELTVFIPGSPNPTTGRLLMIAADKVQFTEIPVNDAFRMLVAVGKSEIELG